MRTSVVSALVQAAAFYAVVWVVTRVVTTLVFRFCSRCELSCIRHVNMLGNVFSSVGILASFALAIERASLAWSLFYALLAAIGIHALSRKLRPPAP